MRLRKALASLTLLAIMAATLPGCIPTQGGGDVAYVEDENARLKQLLIQYENDARNNQVTVADANGRVQRVNLELEAANRKISVYEQEIPRLRNLAVQAAQSAQSANQAQYAQYQQYVQYMNQLNKNQARLVGTGQGTLRQDLSQQLSSLADQFGGVVVGNRLELPGDFFFDSGRYNLNPNARAAIRRMAEILAGENLQLMVVGHTDNDPVKNPALRSKGITDNLHLSLLRAKAVVDELKKAGYPSNLMYPTGWGELRPIVPNTDRASKKLNRRVDILIDPTSAQTQGMSEITGVEPVTTTTATSTSTTQLAYDGEPMATTYTQGYPQASATLQTTTTTTSYTPSSPSYSTIESVETIEGPTSGTGDLLGAPNVYGTSSYDSYSSGSSYAEPTYSDPTSYAVPSYSEPSYAAPSYSAPGASYGTPAPSYGAPDPSFGVPQYGAPAPSFGAPSPYGAPQQQQYAPYGGGMPQQMPGYAPQPQYDDPFNPVAGYNNGPFDQQPLAMGQMQQRW